MIKDLNIRPETIKFLGKKKFFEIGLSNDFLDLTPKSKAKKSKNKQMGLHQRKKLRTTIRKKGKRKKERQTNKRQTVEKKKIQ